MLAKYRPLHKECINTADETCLLRKVNKTVLNRAAACMRCQFLLGVSCLIETSTILSVINSLFKLRRLMAIFSMLDGDLAGVDYESKS